MSVTFTEERHGRISKLKAVVVSAADGSASGTSSRVYTGEVVRFVVIPAAGGSQPTTLFDVALNDADGYDILAGQGANLSNAAPTTVVASMGAIAGDPIAVAASGMGDTKTATLILYVKQ
jgi:hypothetical protein